MHSLWCMHILFSTAIESWKTWMQVWKYSSRADLKVVCSNMIRKWVVGSYENNNLYSMCYISFPYMSNYSSDHWSVIQHAPIYWTQRASIALKNFLQALIWLLNLCSVYINYSNFMYLHAGTFTWYIGLVWLLTTYAFTDVISHTILLL